MTATSIPAVLDALVQKFRATAGVQVIDGQPLRDDIEPDVIVVGYSPVQPSVDAAEYTPEIRGEIERFDVACLASSWSDQQSAKVVRDRVFGLYDSVDGALAADPTLGGAVIRALVRVLGLDQAQTDKGATATIEFTVRVDGFIP